MNEQHGTDITAERQSDFDPMRRNLLKLAGVGVAALGIAAIADTPAAIAQDMSNGADNFYTSDEVSVQKVAFKNQYQMNGVHRNSPRTRP
jgi:uncharacterized protein